MGEGGEKLREKIRWVESGENMGEDEKRWGEYEYRRRWEEDKREGVSRRRWGEGKRTITRVFVQSLLREGPYG